MTDTTTFDLFAAQHVFPAPSVPCETSEAAADSLAPKVLGRLRANVMMYFASVSGCDDALNTADAVEAALNGRHQTVSARVRELVQLGYLVDTGRTAKTRSGRAARVYELTEKGRNR